MFGKRFQKNTIIKLGMNRPMLVYGQDIVVACPKNALLVNIFFALRKAKKRSEEYYKEEIFFQNIIFYKDSALARVVPKNSCQQ